MQCREIVSSDLDSIIGLLNDGFRPSRGRAFWAHAVACLTEHKTPPGYPRYGYLLESGGAPVGVILMIFSTIPDNETVALRCNVSSWCIKPAFRMYAPLLISRALSRKNVTYLNITPAPHTLRILEAQGYKQYSRGRFIAVPALCGKPPDARIEAVSATTQAGNDLTPWDVALLRTHAGYGCISVVCGLAGSRHPFVFAPRLKYGIIPFAFLVYCHSTESFVRCAGPIGRFLARRRIPMVLLDADEKVPGLVGLYNDRNPKYFKGPHRPSQGDLAYTERAMFGV